MKTRKTGIEKFESLVKAFAGKKISIKRIMGYTGLNKNSVYWYASRNRFGRILNGKLSVPSFYLWEASTA